MQELEKILEGIENLHTKILNDGFARKVTEQEIMALVDAKDIIRKHMNDGWIPVKERLPKDGQFVLTCGESGWMKTAWYNARLNLWDTGPSLADLRADAVAWMPLPEPCRESEVEKDEENM